MYPTITKIIFILERKVKLALKRSNVRNNVDQLHITRINSGHFFEMLGFIGIAEIHHTNFEHIQMSVCPSHCNLNDVMESGELCFQWNQQPSPDWWINIFQGNFHLVYRLCCSAHHLNLEIINFTPD